MLPEYTLHLINYLRKQPGGNALSWYQLNDIVDCFSSTIYLDTDVYCSKQKRPATVGLVYSGLFKCVPDTTTGTEKVHDIICYGYNDILADWDYFIDNTSSGYSFVSVGDTVVIEVSETRFNNLCNSYSFLNSVMRRMIKQSYSAKTRLMKECDGLSNKEIQNKIETNLPVITDRLTFTQLG